MRTFVNLTRTRRFVEPPSAARSNTLLLLDDGRDTSFSVAPNVRAGFSSLATNVEGVFPYFCGRTNLPSGEGRETPLRKRTPVVLLVFMLMLSISASLLS